MIGFENQPGLIMLVYSSGPVVRRQGTTACEAFFVTLSPTLEKYFPVRPETKHEADVMALKLFCLLSFILVGLITAGVL